MNTVPDAQENLKSHIRLQELADQKQMNSDVLSQKRQTDMQKLSVDREKNLIELQKAKIQADGALAVARENKTASELKRKTTKKK